MSGCNEETMTSYYEQQKALYAARRKQIKKEYERGDKVNDIAARHGISRQRVWKIATTEGK